MSVDDRLLARFHASRQRLAAARRVLPEHWRTDPRAEAQVINDHWVLVIARAVEQHEQREQTEAPRLVSASERKTGRFQASRKPTT